MNFLISTPNSLQGDWMSFALWYSSVLNFPNPNFTVMLCRTQDQKITFNWSRRVGVSLFSHKNVGFSNKHINKLYSLWVALRRGLVRFPLFVVDPDLVFVRSFSSKTNDLMCNIDFGYSGPVLYFKDCSLLGLKDIIECYNDQQEKYQGNEGLISLLKNFIPKSSYIADLCCNAKDHMVSSFVHYNLSCGNFNKSKNGLRVHPFDRVFRFNNKKENTPNETLVFNLWQQANTLYNSVR